MKPISACVGFAVLVSLHRIDCEKVLHKNWFVTKYMLFKKYNYATQPKLAWDKLSKEITNDVLIIKC